ncbi:MAG: NB-ARC domain-containing protein, partial [Cyanobacteria bacterium P01_D01_bin.6]
MQRPEHFDAVKSMLLDESTPGTLVISAIYGMGGIGKSVLAAALVQDSEIQMRFPDGVLWVTLGQQPDMLSMVNLWIRELGDYDYKPTTLDAASLHLRTLLADKQALLVVDDVWNPEHVKPFRIGGAGCCVLVTTRQTQITGAKRYDLDLMTPQQSLELLTQCLQHDLSDAEQAQAEAFAKEVGYLPLALELAAARVEEGFSWEDLLNAFRSEMDALEALDDSDVEMISDEATRKQYSLIASFNLTLKLLSPQKLAKFTWLGILPEDVTLTQQMAATLWDMNIATANKTLIEFRKRALLLSQAQRSGEKPTYRIHDLVHDLAKTLLTHEQYLGELQGLGLTIEQAHAQFLERYRNQTKNGLWHTVPDDGYIHAHLAWHFERAQQPELLHQLLKESTPEGRNGWYEACERLGQTANFVTDVARAWEAAEALYEQDAIASIALQCRYALITTTLNSLAQNIPSVLIGAFVQKRFWKPAQGLAYVRQIQQSRQRADALGALAHHLPKGLMREAIEVACTIQDESFRARTLRELAKYLPERLMREALEVARTIQDHSARARALSDLAEYLPEVASEALEVARTIQDDSARARALSDLAEYLPEVASEALEVARTIQDHSARARALS